MSSCGFLWVLVGKIGRLGRLVKLRICVLSLNSLNSLHSLISFVSSFEFLWVSFVILNAVKNLSGCDKGCAIPEILRFAQDDRLEWGLVRFGGEALKKNSPPELIRTYQNPSHQNLPKPTKNPSHIQAIWFAPFNFSSFLAQISHPMQ